MNRVRDNSTVRLIAASETVYEADGSISHGPTSDTFSTIQADVMTDEVTPGFRRASASGEVFIKPMKRVQCARTTGPGNTAIQVFDGPRHVSNGYPVLRGLEVSPWADEKVIKLVTGLEGEAITESFARVGSPDVAVLTELAELKETLAFLSSPVRAMVKLTRRFRRHLDVVSRMELVHQRRLAKWQSLPDRVRARREQPVPPKLPAFKVGKWEGKDIPSAWLAYRYGIMPLIYTFQDVEALLKKRVEGVPIRATARSKKEGSVDLSGTDGSHQFTWRGDSVYRLDEITSGGCRVTVRAGVLYNVDASLKTQLGIQWNRVPMALYEAIPLSFVSDWFHNGAEVYDALTAEFRSKGILGSWVVTRIDFDVQYRDEISSIANCSASGQRTLNVSGTIKERKLTSGSDVKFSFTNGLNLKRVADGLALCYTLLATARKK